MSEDKKETNDILEEAIASVKAAKKQATENPVEEKKAEPSQEELLKLIKELKSEISDIKKANEEDDLDDVDDDSEDDDDLDAEDDTDDEDEKEDDDNSENERLKSEVENLKKQLEEQNKKSSSTQQKGNSKVKWAIGCLSLVIGCFVASIILAMCCSNTEVSSLETETNENKTSIVELPIPTGEYAGIIMFYREYKWYFFGACVFIFLCKILLREGEERWGLVCRYVIFTGLLLYPILSQDYEVYNEDDEFSNVLVFFGFFTAFFIIPILYWFFGEISKCPECGTTYAFEEVGKEYDHALAPKYARDFSGNLKKDWHGNTYRVQTVYYRVTLRCRNCGYTKQEMRKVEEKI